MNTFHIAYADAVKKIPVSDGKRFAEMFRHGTLLVELYEPRDTDAQTPHTRDEGYIVVKGTGDFVNGKDRVKFVPEDFLFAATGAVHRFENFTDDLSVWVIFYGPEGGEKP